MSSDHLESFTIKANNKLQFCRDEFKNLIYKINETLLFPDEIPVSTTSTSSSL